MKKENINEEWSRNLAEVLKEEFRKRKDKDKDFKQETFAEELNISPSTLTLLLKGERNIRIDSAYNIAKALNCSIDYLVGLSSIPNREWNDVDKSISLLQQKTGLSKKAFDRVLYLYSMGSLYKDWIYAIETIISARSPFLKMISEYLNFLPIQENAYYWYDSKTIKGNGYHSLNSITFYDDSREPMIPLKLDQQKIEDMLKDEVLSSLPSLKEEGFRTYLANKRRLQFCSDWIEEINNETYESYSSEDKEILSEQNEELMYDLQDYIENYKNSIHKYETYHHIKEENNGKE